MAAKRDGGVRALLGDRKAVRGVVTSLYAAARLARKLGPRRGGSRPRRVVHVAPSYFSDRSCVGGGERYAMSLAKEVAKHVETTLVSFGGARDSFREGDLRVEIYPALKLMNGLVWDPVSYGFLREVMRADVVHCYQYKTIVTNLAILAGAALGRRVCVTDLAGVGYHFAEMFPLADFVDYFLPISAYSQRTLPQFKRVEVIYGGVDERFLEDGAQERRAPKVLFVGRLLPHKGVNYLIEAVDGDTRLEVLGRPYDADYLGLLRRLAEGKNVRLVTDASDEDLIRAYRSSAVTVLPSVYSDVYGHTQKMPELLGLVMLESMACGTPVVCTDVGGMPEFVEHGVTGFVVPPNDPGALRERISYLLQNPEEAARLGREGRRRVLERFTWEAAARRCLSAYGGA